MKLLLVDDHPLLMAGVETSLKGVAPGCDVVKASDLDSALQRVSEHPDIALVLLDLGLPGCNGIDALLRFKADSERLPVVVLSGQFDRQTVFACLDAGAMGFVPKVAETEEFVAALDRIINKRKVYVPGEVFAAGRDEAPLPKTVVHPAFDRPIAELRDFGLTPRQTDILRLLLQGKSNKVIARELDIVESTVKQHVTLILKALKVENRRQAILVAVRLGLDLR